MMSENNNAKTVVLEVKSEEAETKRAIEALYEKHIDFFTDASITSAADLLEVLQWNIPLSRGGHSSELVTFHPEFSVDRLNKRLTNFSVDLKDGGGKLCRPYLNHSSPTVETLLLAVSTDYFDKGMVKEVLLKMEHQMIDDKKLPPMHCRNADRRNTANAQAFLDKQRRNNNNNYRKEPKSKTRSNNNNMNDVSFSRDGGDDSGDDIEHGNSSSFHQNEEAPALIFGEESEQYIQSDLCDPSYFGFGVVEHASHKSIIGVYLRLPTYSIDEDKETVEMRCRIVSKKEYMNRICRQVLREISAVSNEYAVTEIHYSITNTVFNFGSDYVIYNGCTYARTNEAPWCVIEPTTGIVTLFGNENCFTKKTIVGGAVGQAHCIDMLMMKANCPAGMDTPVLMRCKGLDDLSAPCVVSSNTMDNRRRVCLTQLHSLDGAPTFENLDALWFSCSYDVPSADEKKLVEMLFVPVFFIACVPVPDCSKCSVQDLIKTAKRINAEYFLVDEDNNVLIGQLTLNSYGKLSKYKADTITGLRSIPISEMRHPYQ